MGFGLGGLFNSSSSSSSTNSTETDSNVDNRVVDADFASVGGNVSLSSDGAVSDVSITTTDFGAIERAAGVAEMSIASNADAVAALKAAASGAIDTAKTVAANATRDEGAKTVQIAVIGGVVVFAIVMLIKRR